MSTSEPDIRPRRLTPVDIAALDHVETRAVLVHLAGHEDPAVAGAVVDAVREVLERTRCGESGGTPPPAPLRVVPPGFW